jgi:hypothetical protein
MKEKFLLCISILFLTFCSERKNATVNIMNNELPIVKTWVAVEESKNKKVLVYGKLQAFTPVKTGKGAGYMFWDYEILLNDSTAIPVIAKAKFLNLEKFITKNVVIEGKIFYGIIIGSDNPNEQSATGYRIDAEKIQEIDRQR